MCLEEQESSRKRRREKRETLLKAYAKSQAEAGNVERAEAITKQMAVNMNNIKIHLKRERASGVVTAADALSLSGAGDSLRSAKVHRYALSYVYT